MFSFVATPPISSLPRQTPPFILFPAQNPNTPNQFHRPPPIPRPLPAIDASLAASACRIDLRVEKQEKAALAFHCCEKSGDFGCWCVLAELNFGFWCGFGFGSGCFKFKGRSVASEVQKDGTILGLCGWGTGVLDLVVSLMSGV